MEQYTAECAYGPGLDNRVAVQDKSPAEALHRATRIGTALVQDAGPVQVSLTIPVRVGGSNAGLELEEQYAVFADEGDGEYERERLKDREDALSALATCGDATRIETITVAVLAREPLDPKRG